MAWERLGWETVAFVERDPFCRAVLSERWPEVPQHDDVREFSGEPFQGRVDLVSGGFPCQPFSVAGSRKGHADDRYLWSFTWRTPQARDGDPRGAQCPTERLAGGHSVGLPDEVEPSTPGSPRARLNPDWVETLQGYPIGWTRVSAESASKLWATRLSRRSRTRSDSPS